MKASGTSVGNRIKQLKRIYFDVKSPGAFGGINRLAKASKQPIKDVRDFLLGEDVYTLHVTKRKRFPRRKTYAPHMRYLYEIDLMDLSKYKKENDGVTFVLMIIDVFSKFLWMFPLKNKSGKSIIENLQKLFRSGNKPLKIRSDKGSEFTNRTVQKFLREQNVYFYTSNDPNIKCSIVERVIRTIKSKMFRYFTFKGKHRYVDILNDLANAYNSSVHRSIKIAPKDVTKNNEKQVYNTLYGVGKEGNTDFKYEVGDLVRITREKHRFDKGYEKTFTDEVFRIKKRLPTNPPTYIIEDMLDSPILGSFYAEELQKVKKTDDSLWHVDKILKQRKRGGQIEYYVSFLGFTNPKFNRWIKKSELRAL